jgi:hypothetical protein
MAGGLSPYFKRGSAGLVIALMVFLPMLVAVLLEVYLGDEPENMLWNLKVLPPFSGYQALQMIDAGIGGMFNFIFQNITGTFELPIYLAASMVWGALFLAIGLMRVKGKEL